MGRLGRSKSARIFRSGAAAWFVLSRIGDFKIYEVCQKSGFSREAATQFVRSVLEDPSPYEISKH
jgi:hypothetical protein